MIELEHILAAIAGAGMASYLIGMYIDKKVREALHMHMLTATWEFLTEEGKRYKVTTEPPEIE
jgi:hypothetical protein